MVSRLSSLQTTPGSRMQSCGGTEHLLLILPIRFPSCPPAVHVAALQSHLQQAQRPGSAAQTGGPAPAGL